MNVWFQYVPYTYGHCIQLAVEVNQFSVKLKVHRTWSRNTVMNFPVYTEFRLLSSSFSSSISPWPLWWARRARTVHAAECEMCHFCIELKLLCDGIYR